MKILRQLKKFTLFFKVLWSFMGLGIFCEYGIYYVVLYQCSWPKLTADPNLVLKAMFLADTHLLGPFKGHWFDKLRREWQMHRAFQTAVNLFEPEAIFFLGDVFDEGMWVDFQQHNEYVRRFNSLFQVPLKSKRYIVTGNHDIGFHYVITPVLYRRFRDAFNSSAVRYVYMKGTSFILINSMAMEGDGCFLCKPAMDKLHNISEKLKCDKNPGASNCHKLNYTPKRYSQPVLLQHFPMYRKSDETCTGTDAASESERQIAFRERLDCLSKSSSEFLLDKINPRLILSGHTHNGCVYHHNSSNLEGSPELISEFSVPSFSWRNRNDPSFYLGLFTRTSYALEKCAMPCEDTVIRIYWWGSILITYYFLIRRFLPSLTRIVSSFNQFLNTMYQGENTHDE